MRAWVGGWIPIEKNFLFQIKKAKLLPFSHEFAKQENTI